MKIVVLAGFAPSLINFRGPLLREMVNLGHEVVAVAPEADPDTATAIEALGVRFRSLRLKRNQISVGADLGFVHQMVKLLREERPDLLFSYTHKPVIYGSIAAVWAGVRQRVSMISGLGYPFEANTWKHLLIRLIMGVLFRVSLSFNRVVIFHNADDLDTMVRWGFVSRKRTAVVGGSGVDLTHYQQKPLPKGSPRVLMISRLVRSKGVCEYVEAARIVREKRPDITFDLVGPADPHPLGLTDEAAREWQTRGWVEYHGAKQDVRPYLEQCHLYVLPSWAEGLPRSVLEAMGTGRAIITTDTRGCRETVEHGVNGELVPLRNPEALAASILRLIDDREKLQCMGQASRELVMQRFEVGSVNRDMLSLLGLK